MHKRLTLTGSTLRAREVDFKTGIARELLNKVWPLLNNGSITPVIDSCFPLAQAELAHARLISNQHTGKIILELNHDF